MTGGWLAALVLAQANPFDRGFFDESLSPLRIGVVTPAVAITVDGAGAGPAATLHTSALVRQGSGVEASALSFDFVGGTRAPRLAFQLVDVHEVIFGSKSGRVCAPPVFLVGSPMCDFDTGHLGLGAMALHTDTAFGKGTNLRLVDATLRAVLPAAFGSWYQAVRVASTVGAALDYAVGWAGRLTVGLDFFTRPLQTKWDVSFSVRWRPSFTDFTGDQVVHGEVRALWRAKPMLAAVFFLGAAYATRPERSVGAFLSRDERLSAWVGLGLEGTSGATYGGSTPNP
jgi:hypothetical protein